MHVIQTVCINDSNTNNCPGVRSLSQNLIWHRMKCLLILFADWLSGQEMVNARRITSSWLLTERQAIRRTWSPFSGRPDTHPTKRILPPVLAYPLNSRLYLLAAPSWSFSYKSRYGVWQWRAEWSQFSHCSYRGHASSRSSWRRVSTRRKPTLHEFDFRLVSNTK